LSQQGADELTKLNLLAERYEDEDMKPMPMAVTLCAVVEAKKEELGVTQKELASVLGIAPNYPKYSTENVTRRGLPEIIASKKLGIDGNLFWSRYKAFYIPTNHKGLEIQRFPGLLPC